MFVSFGKGNQNKREREKIRKERKKKSIIITKKKQKNKRDCSELIAGDMASYSNLKNYLFFSF